MDLRHGFVIVLHKYSWLPYSADSLWLGFVSWVGGETLLKGVVKCLEPPCGREKTSGDDFFCKIYTVCPYKWVTCKKNCVQKSQKLPKNGRFCKPTISSSIWGACCSSFWGSSLIWGACCSPFPSSSLIWGASVKSAAKMASQPPSLHTIKENDTWNSILIYQTRKFCKKMVQKAHFCPK